jgi:predicted GTPase
VGVTDAPPVAEDPSDELRVAAESAVEHSRELGEWLNHQVRAVLAGFGDDLPVPDIDGGLLPAATLAEAGQREAAVSAAVVAGFTTMLELQYQHRDTFNIALFGRTGAGKSSLIEAMTHGDGDAISPGESDHTETVCEVPWRSLRLFDTPGIEGWGRRTASEVLEQRARTALASADVVLLCFDDLGQRAGEFTKIREWVAEFGKPVVAVINSRNDLWRNPVETPSRAQRLSMSQEVAEHAANTRAELVRAGLAGTPVMALNTQRAFFARGRPDRAGRLARSMRAVRERYSLEQLLEWSNLPVLERLLVEAIQVDAEGLRFGAMLRQTAGTATAAARSYEPLAAELSALVEPLERGVEQTVEIVGCAGPADDPASAQLAEALRELVAARRTAGCTEALRLPEIGSAEQYARNLIGQHLAGCRAESLDRANEFVAKAMRTKAKLDEAAFIAEVFDREALATAEQNVWTAYREHLSLRTGLIAADVGADIRAAASQLDPRLTGKVHGNRGSWLRWAGVGVGGAGVAVPLVAVFFVSNPLGWAALVTLVVTPIVARLAKRLLDHFSARRRERALAEGRTATRAAVREAFQARETGLLGELMAQTRQALLPSVIATARQAAYLRRLLALIAQRRAALDALADRIPVAPRQPAEIFATAVRSCETRYGVTERDAARLWLGESWCDTGTVRHWLPDRLWRARAVPAPGPWHAYLYDRVSAALAMTTGSPPPGTGREWLARTTRRLHGDGYAERALKELAEIAGGRPRIAVCGDYDAGKTSFIRRLFEEVGRRPPQGLVVKASPATATATGYRWKGLTIVDTPGLQAPGSERTRKAQHGHVRAAVRDAALVIWLFTPISGGDTGELARMLRGDSRRGLVPRADRALFVINRIDTLGVSPADDPDEFRRLRESKESELFDLVSRLATEPDGRGPTVHPEQVMCLASDPYGLGPAGRAQQWAWDDVTHFVRALLGARPALAATGVDNAVLAGGLARLGFLAAQGVRGIGEVERELDRLDRLRLDVGDSIASGRAILDDRRSHLELIVRNFLDARIDAVFKRTEENRRNRAQHRLDNFDTDGELLAEIGHWQRATESVVAEWARLTRVSLQTSSATEIGLAPVRERRGVTRLLRRRPRSGQVGAEVGAAVSAVGRWARGAADIASTTSRAGVLTRLARFARVSGPALTVVGAAFDVSALVREWYRWEEADRTRQESIATLHEHGRRWAAAVADADVNLGNVALTCTELEQAVVEVGAKRREWQEQVDQARARVARYHEAMADARVLLGIERDGDDGG